MAIPHVWRTHTAGAQNAVTILTEDERQELQRHFVGLAQREVHIVQMQ
jgi:hypothetical protein